jgi:hypothetical protein
VAAMLGYLKKRVNEVRLWRAEKVPFVSAGYVLLDFIAVAAKNDAAGSFLKQSGRSIH